MESIYNSVSDFAYGGFGVLINWLWIGLFVTALVWAVMRFSRSFSGKTGYAVWWVQLVTVLALPLLIWTLPSMLASLSANAAPEQVSVGHKASTQAGVHSEAALHPKLMLAQPASLEQNRPEAKPKAVAAVTTEHRVERTFHAIKERAQSRFVSDKSGYKALLLGVLPQSLLIFWVTIASLLLSRIVRAHNYMKYLKRTSEPFDWGYLRRFEPEFRALCGPRKVEVCLTDQIPHPMAAGLGRPVILLPSHLIDELSADDLRATILHELTHLRRWDDWSKLGQKVVQALVFFHPAVHWVGRQLDFEREVACDERVVELTGNRSAYAQCLTRLVQLTTGAGTTLMPGALSTRRQIFKRFARLLSGRSNERTATKGLRLAVTLVLVAVSTVAAIQIAPSVAVPGQPPSYEQIAQTARLLVTPPETDPVLPEAPTVTPLQIAIEDFEPPAPEPLECPESLPQLTLDYYDGGLVAVGHNQKHPVNLAYYVPGTSSALSAPSVPSALSAPAAPAEPSVPAVGEVAWFSDDEADVDDASERSKHERKKKADKSFFEGEIDAKGDLDNGNFKGTYINHGDDGGYTIRWSDGRNFVEAYVEGEVVFTEDDRGIASLSRDGYLELTDRSRRGRHILEVEPESDGSLSYSYWVDGSSQDFDDEGREWLADVLIEIIRRTGIGAEGRVKRIMADDGVDGVLDEIYKIESDYVQRLYLNTLLEQPGLSDDNYASILRLVRSDLDSDYEKAELLVELADRVRDNESLMEFYVDGVATIDSDYDKRRTINALMLGDEISTEMLAKILAIAEEIDSDYEKAELLIDMAPHVNALDRNDAAYDQALQSYINAVIDIDSDYETRRVLSELSLDRSTDKDMLLEVLHIARRIDSDYEKAELLLDMSKLIGDNPALHKAYIEAIDEVDSDYELRRIITALSDETDNYTRDDLEYLLGLANMMDSDYEKAELLLDLSRHCKDDDELLGQLMDGAESIDSDYEKKRVLKDCMPSDCERQKSLSRRALGVIDDLDSDYEKAEALLEIVHCAATEPDLHGLFLDALGGMDSDYDRRRVLAEFLDEASMTDDLMVSLLDLVEKFDSDYDKAQMLSDMADYCQGNDMLEDEFVRVVETMDSDYDMNRLYRRLYGRDYRDRSNDDL